MEYKKGVERIKTFTKSATIISLLLLGIMGFNILSPVSIVDTVANPTTTDPSIIQNRKYDGFSANASSVLKDRIHSGPLGEVGMVEQAYHGSWHTVDLQNTYVRPVVIMEPVSYNGGDPAHVRLRNVDTDSFEYKIEEWSGGDHTTETMHYIVMESGTHTLADGTKVEAGTISMTNCWGDPTRVWYTIQFSQSFSAAPVTLTQVQSYNGNQAVVTRERDVGRYDFDVIMREKESRDNTHARETIGYLAIAEGTGTNNNNDFEAGRTPNTVTDDPNTINFQHSYGSAPLFIAWMETTDGGDTADVRYESLSSSSVDVFIDEETSADEETGHTSEVIGYFAFASSKGIIGQTTPWGIRKINARDAEVEVNDGWEDEIDVAVLDTGVDPDHEDLQGNIAWKYNELTDTLEVLPMEMDMALMPRVSSEH